MLLHVSACFCTYMQFAWTGFLNLDSIIYNTMTSFRLLLGSFSNPSQCAVQAAVQALISSLEPIFPEIAGMGVSSNGLIEAIHGCELRLVHAHEAVLVSGVLSVFVVAVVE